MCWISKLGVQTKSLFVSGVINNALGIDAGIDIAVVIDITTADGVAINNTDYTVGRLDLGQRWTQGELLLHSAAEVRFRPVLQQNLPTANLTEVQFCPQA